MIWSWIQSFSTLWIEFLFVRLNMVLMHTRFAMSGQVSDILLTRLGSECENFRGRGLWGQAVVQGGGSVSSGCSGCDLTATAPGTCNQASSRAGTAIAVDQTAASGKPTPWELVIRDLLQHLHLSSSRHRPSVGRLQ